MGGRHMGGGLAWGAGEGLRKGEVGEQRWGKEGIGQIWVLQGSGGPVQPSGDWGVGPPVRVVMHLPLYQGT